VYRDLPKVTIGEGNTCQAIPGEQLN
jgi:hypothetical protein